MSHVIALLALASLAAACCAQAPAWIGPVGAPSADGPVAFSGAVDLPSEPDRALLRVAAYDRYRLLVNGRAVSVGDTPWDGETYDVTSLLTAGPNSVVVEAERDASAPANCWLWLRRSLPAPGRYDRLTFRTRGARGDEWLYVEVLDADGRSSGLYCLERGHSDLMLGSGGEEAEHVIDLRADGRLDTGDGDACDFGRIAALRFRMDQKETARTPSGRVVLSEVALTGDGRVDLSGPDGWTLEPGVGEHRRSAIEPEGDAAFALRYDFAPASDPAVAVDLRAWRAGAEIARLVSGPDWGAGGKPAEARPSPADPVSWTALAVRGPDDPVTPVCTVAVLLDFGGADRCAEGESLFARVVLRSCEPAPAVTAEVWAESWSGDEVFRAPVELRWDGTAGRGGFATPALPPGLYRFTVELAGRPSPERHSALAVLPRGETRLSSLFAALTPLPPREGLCGVDLNWFDSPALLLGIRDQGANLLQVHLGSGQIDNGELADLFAFCRATGLRFALNNEEANWSPSAVAADGRDRFVAPDGCHRWDLEPAVLDAAAATGLFEGVVYDEGEHMQLCRNYYYASRGIEDRPPYLVETAGMALAEARDAFTAAARAVDGYHQEHGARMLVESVFPVLWHPLADAGVTLCPKLLKEDIHPVVLAQALGAAKQYGAELWLTPDLWYLDEFPGHTVQEYRDALRLADLAGVDNVYTEAFAALCRLRGAAYELTEYGVALRDFARTTRPRDRGYTYRDYEPEVAIIRFPDSDWGQASCYYWQSLYGAANLAPTEDTGEWLAVWNLLTGGATHPGAVNANSSVYARGTWRFSYPAAPVAVYDDRVGAGPLATVDTIFVCGISVSGATLEAVARRVQAGATCFIARRLCPEEILRQAPASPGEVADGRGSWIVVSGFRPEDLGAYVARVPAAGETMRLRFGGREVALPMGSEP